jgi:hypothetical protein
MFLALAVLLLQPSTVPIQVVTNLPIQSASYSLAIWSETQPQRATSAALEAKDSAAKPATPAGEIVFPAGSSLAAGPDAWRPDTESSSFSFLPGQTELTPITSTEESSSRTASESMPGRVSSTRRSSPYHPPAELAGRAVPKMWYILGAIEHGAATFDAWSTRRAIQSGVGREMNPMLRPFANSGSLYGAVQVAPFLFDMLAKHMLHSSHAWERKIWWVPQTASAVASFAAGAHNLSIH